jgi:transcription initiation factor TFIIIB Brf1 subunit/transcription initiation factor TFIIB
MEIIELCLNCGSDDYIEDYPEHGRNTCNNCGQETGKIKLTLKGLKDGVPKNCSNCRKKMEDEDIFFEKLYDQFVHNQIVVIKCTKCGSLFGHRVFDDSGDDYELYDDDSYDGLSVKIAGKEGRYGYSASAAKRFQKKLRKIEKSPIGKCQIKLRKLIKDKNYKMKKAGIYPITINLVTFEIQDFLNEKGPFTMKQLSSILGAAFSLLQRTDNTVYRSLIKIKIPDNHLEEIFDIKRKTIRKWRKILQKYSLFTMRDRKRILF